MSSPPSSPSGEALSALLRLSGAASPGGVGGGGSEVGPGGDGLKADPPGADYTAFEVLRLCTPGGPGRASSSSECRSSCGGGSPPVSSSGASSAEVTLNGGSVVGAGDSSFATPPRSLLCWEVASSSAAAVNGSALDNGYGSGSGEFSPVVRPPSSVATSGGASGCSEHSGSEVSSSVDALAASLEVQLRLGPLVGDGAAKYSKVKAASEDLLLRGSSSSASPSPPAIALAKAVLEEEEDDRHCHGDRTPDAGLANQAAGDGLRLDNPNCEREVPAPDDFLGGGGDNSTLAANLAALAKLNEIQELQQQPSPAFSPQQQQQHPLSSESVSSLSVAGSDAGISLVSTEFVNAGIAAAAAQAAAAAAAALNGGGPSHQKRYFGGGICNGPDNFLDCGGGGGVPPYEVFQQQQQHLHQNNHHQPQLGRSFSVPASALDEYLPPPRSGPDFYKQQHQQQLYGPNYRNQFNGYSGMGGGRPQPPRGPPQLGHHQYHQVDSAADWGKLLEPASASVLMGRNSPFFGGSGVGVGGPLSSPSSSPLPPPGLDLMLASPGGGSPPGGPGGPGGVSNQMQIRCKFGQLGNQPGMFNAPHGFCLGLNQEIIVADTNNHRIQIFDTNGLLRYLFGVAGKEEGCLWYPRKVAVLRPSGSFVVCDRGGERSRMQIFDSRGNFLLRIAIRFIDIVAGLAVSRRGHIVAVDSVTPTVFFISEQGRLDKYLECSEFMTEPSDIAVHEDEYYICDFKGHRVVVIDEDGNLLRRIGSEAVTPFPNGIDISDAGDVLIGDSHGNQFHVAVYSNEGTQLLSQFTCPNVKVSRCCGLKITSEGFVVTLAKNNHHVLVLNTLYVA